MSSNFREERLPQRLLVQDIARLDDVRLKHQRVRCLLEAEDADALLLQDPANIAWFTAGADLRRCGAENCTTSVFVTRDARLFATNAVDSAQIFEREAFGLGFQLKQREWFQPHSELVGDLCRGRTVLSDRAPSGAMNAADRIRQLRLPLTDLEVQRLRLLSKVAVHAVEATAHHLRPGVTESEVAGEVSHRLLKRTVGAARIQVCADGRNERYRHWTFGEHPIQKFAVISCIARRWGLHIGVTRTVCLRTVPDALWAAYQKAALVHATGIFFSRHAELLGDVWKKVHRIYEKFGMANEWQLADQGNVLGYSQNEYQIMPGSDFQLNAPAPVFWHPSVGPAMLGDTVLCRESANDQLTLSGTWPQIPVRVKGKEVSCPGILLLRDPEGLPKPEAGAIRRSGLDINLPDHPDEATPSPLESAWEMPALSNDLSWEEDEEAVWSESSVAE
ncbi:MAG: M24 family metallopeptidase [Planctomycetaceae bacterium]